MSNRLRRIVITGGPCSGKTAATDALRADMPELYFQKEGASLIFGLGVESPAVGSPLVAFNRHFGEALLTFEHLADIHAQNIGKSFIVLDRALPDTMAYMPGGREEFYAAAGITIEQAYERYDLVIYLEMPSKEIFERHANNNPQRKELRHEDAVASGWRTLCAWSGHPALQIVPQAQSFAERVSTIHQLIEKFCRENDLGIQYQ